MFTKFEHQKNSQKRQNKGTFSLQTNLNDNDDFIIVRSRDSGKTINVFAEYLQSPNLRIRIGKRYQLRSD